MTEYIVIRKSDQAEVYRYQSDAPVEWTGMEFATHDHTEHIEAAVPAAPVEVRVWDTIDYLKLLTAQERIAIRTAGQTDPVVADIIDLQRNTSRIRSDDPDLLQALDYLTAIGVLAAGRKQEILNG